MRISGKGGYSMLKQWIPAAKPDKEELDKRLDAAQEELLRLQMQIKEHNRPQRSSDIRFCIVILSISRNRGSSHFWIPAGWMR